MGEEIRKFIGDAQVTYGAECLFGVGSDGKMRWGVKQQIDTPLGNIEWYHHAWGIDDEADAHVLAERINTSGSISIPLDSELP